MYRLSIIFTILVALLLPTIVTAQIAPAWLSLPQHSVASTDDALALLVNPAGLGVGEGGIYFLAPYQSDGRFMDWGLVMGENFAFAAEALRSDPTGTRRRYTWGLGFGDDGTYFGFDYSWTTGIDRQNTWNFGLLERPFSFLSFGAVARGVNNPRLNGEKLPVAWDFGLGFRPLALIRREWARPNDRLTLTADAYLRKFDEQPGQPAQKYFDEIDFKYGVRWEVVPGITSHLDFSPEITGALAHDSRITAGLTFNFGESEVGGFQQSGNGSGSSHIAFRDVSRKTWLKPHKKRFVIIDLSGPIVEKPEGFSIFARENRTVAEFHRQMDQLARDDEVAGVLLRIGDVQCGWAKMQELRGELQEFHASGKKIYAYFESAGNGEYYLASVADKIYLPPAGEVDLVGLSATLTYWRATLRKIGVEPEMAHIGAYKSASDAFMREDMSEAEAEAMNAILDDIYGQFVTGVAEGRGMDEEELKALIDRGPFTADQALKEVLIDSLVYEDQLNDIIEDLAGKPSTITEKEYGRFRPARREWDDLRRKSVAIVYGTGEITSGASSGGGLFGGETMGSNTIVDALRQAREDDEVGAIVFRVDSPGGSALASEMIMREVKRCADDEDGKSIIVSMSDVAGSGGYYVACMADTIIAMPGTITGSIGVIGGKFSIGALESKIGLGKATLKRGKFADWTSSDRTFTDEEWEKLNSQIGETYRIFLQRVSEGRGIDTTKVHEMAQGRIWSGTRAKELNLIDTTGGLDLAISMAAAAAGIEKGETFEIKHYPHNEFDVGVEMTTVARATLPAILLNLGDKIASQQIWRDGEMLMLMPVEIDIK